MNFKAIICNMFKLDFYLYELIKEINVAISLTSEYCPTVHSTVQIFKQSDFFKLKIKILIFHVLYFLLYKF